MVKALKRDGIIYTSFKYGNFEGERNERYFIDFTEEKFNKFVNNIENVKLKEEWITCDFSPKIIFRDKVKLDPYFNKGRDYSLKGKLKKTVSVIYRAIRWYL